MSGQDDTSRNASEEGGTSAGRIGVGMTSCERLSFGAGGEATVHRTRRAPVLPPRIAELVRLELARGFAGDVRIGAVTHRRVMQALRPHEIALAQVLCKETQVLPGGTIRLTVPRNFAYSDEHLETAKSTITVDYDPRTGEWISEVASGWPGFDRLCAHVWRIRGRSDGMATRKLLAHIGAAYVHHLSELSSGQQ